MTASELAAFGRRQREKLIAAGKTGPEIAGVLAALIRVIDDDVESRLTPTERRAAIMALAAGFDYDVLCNGNELFLTPSQPRVVH